MGGVRRVSDPTGGTRVPPRGRGVRCPRVVSLVLCVWIGQPRVWDIFTTSLSSSLYRVRELLLVPMIYELENSVVREYGRV